MESPTLHNRWHALCERIGAFKKIEESDLTFDMLRTLYTHPPRAYHNLDHIAQLLAAFDNAAMLAEDRDAVEFALWLHDCVYFAERPDNEDRSADAAAMIAGLLGCTPDFSARARDCIMATRHSTPPGRGDPALVADLDLTILGASPNDYDQYRKAIRAEFAFVPDDQFIPGRMAFLRRMIDKDHIFATPHFRDMLEHAAKNNLYREQDELERSTPP